MRKQEFLNTLRAMLADLPEADVAERLNFYSEMIDDRIEEGLSEEEAVADLGSIEDIRVQIVKDTPIVKIIKEKVKPKRKLSTLEITLLIVGFPIWFPILISLAAVIFSVYVSLWAVIISVFAVEISFAAGAFAGIVASIPMFILGNSAGALFLFGSGMFCAGLAVLWVFVCKWGVKGIVWLTRVFIKSLFIGRGNE